MINKLYYVITSDTHTLLLIKKEFLANCSLVFEAHNDRQVIIFEEYLNTDWGLAFDYVESEDKDLHQLLTSFGITSSNYRYNTLSKTEHNEVVFDAEVNISTLLLEALEHMVHRESSVIKSACNSGVKQKNKYTLLR